MCYLTASEQLERIHKLIERKGTGSPKNLAQKLNVSENTVFNLIKKLKVLGGPIEYCKTKESYYYTQSTKFQIGYEVIDNIVAIKGSRGHYTSLTYDFFKNK